MAEIIKRFAFCCILFLTVHCIASPAWSAEVIRSFHSAITVEQDGTLLVKETIKVQSEGQEIKRGIFRDFPLYFTDSEGKQSRVGFKVLNVTRDGQNEPWGIDDIEYGIRIYIGNAETFLSPGEYEYEITYETNRQVREHQGYQELYWNVNGNGWRFPIEKITAAVKLPNGIIPDEVGVYTGSYGEGGSDADYAQQGDFATFQTTRLFNAGEGLTIGLKLPENTIIFPTYWQQIYNNGKALSLVVLGVVVVGFYYAQAWRAVGRDPVAGPIVPRWDLPENISPALAHYIFYRGFQNKGWQAFSAAVLALAVKGYLVIKNGESEIILTLEKCTSLETLPPSQRTVMEKLIKEGGTLVISLDNRESILSLGEEFCSVMDAEYEEKYFKKNARYIVIGFLVSAIICLVLFFANLNRLHTGSTGIEDLIFHILLLLWPGFIVLSSSISGRGSKWGDRFRNIANTFENSGILMRFIMVMAAWLISYLLISLALYEDLGSIVEDITIFGLSIIAAFNLVYTVLLRATTPSGQKYLEAIKGLRQYINLTEKDRMNVAGSPEMSPQHFETLLPFASALGLEKPWTQHFAKWLATATAAQAGYSAVWYQDNLGSGSLKSIRDFSSSFPTTIASTLTPPSASSGSSFGGGGGGGFSGGGGGGGGGGGW